MEPTPSTKHSKRRGDGGPRGSLCWSVSEMQGWRETMEDAHLTIPSLREAVQSLGIPRRVWSWHVLAHLALQQIPANPSKSQQCFLAVPGLLGPLSGYFGFETLVTKNGEWWFTLIYLEDKTHGEWLSHWIFVLKILKQVSKSGKGALKPFGDSS